MRLASNGTAYELFHELTPQRTLEQLVLPEHVRGACMEFVEEQHRADVLRSYNLQPRNRILLAGSPGNGKTLLAEALASAPWFHSSLSAMTA